MIEPLADAPPPRTSETLLINSLQLADETSLLCTSLGRAQLAAHVAAHSPNVQVSCNYLDLFQAKQARQAVGSLPNLQILCQADFPEAEFDVAALPLHAQGDSELTRDLLQTAHLRLREGGTLWVATDNPRDRWLREELEKIFDRVSAHAVSDGVVYRATKNRPLKKVKKYASEFVFRDGERLIRAVSRPGVFSHRHVDPGARALLEVVLIRDGDRVFELGCGAGTVAVSVASRANGVEVVAVDSNPRAIECALASAELNGLTNVRAILNDEGECGAPGSFDVVLANPPYFSQHRISEIFIRGAVQALRDGGTALFVTKSPDWFVDAMTEHFLDLRLTPIRGYVVVSGVKPSSHERRTIA